MAAPVSDLPAPLSPTTPSTSPGPISKETSSSARSTPRRVGNSTVRSRTSAAGHRSSPQPRVQRVAQPIAEQIDRQHHQHERDARENRHPPLAAEQEVISYADQRAERGLGRRQARRRGRTVSPRPGSRAPSVSVAITSTGPHHVGQDVASAMMRSGESPITRAASTYSLSRSTSVEPRTVRANCGQRLMPIARIST